MTFSKKHKPAPKKSADKKKLAVADHSNKSPYSKQNIKRFTGFEDNNFLRY
jgi:hypothetical protein